MRCANWRHTRLFGPPPHYTRNREGCRMPASRQPRSTQPEEESTWMRDLCSTPPLEDGGGLASEACSPASS